MNIEKIPLVGFLLLGSLPCLGEVNGKALCGPNPYEIICNSNRVKAEAIQSAQERWVQIHRDEWDTAFEDSQKQENYLKLELALNQLSTNKASGADFEKEMVLIRQRGNCSEEYVANYFKEKKLQYSPVIYGVLEECGEVMMRVIQASRLLSLQQQQILIRNMNDHLTRARLTEFIGISPAGWNSSDGTFYLSIGAEMWKTCAEKEPYCYAVIFHELGHLLSAWIAVEQTPERLLFIANNKQDRQELFNELVASTASLRQMLNGVFELGNRADILLTRDASLKSSDTQCDLSYVKEMDKWDEAEADFWGASGFAYWLEREEDTGNRISEMIGSMLPNCRFNGEDLSLFGAHALWNIRYNNIILRNKDLRRSLGCDPLDNFSSIFTSSPLTGA